MASGLSKKLSLTDEGAAFIGKKECSRLDANKAIWKYLKENFHDGEKYAWPIQIGGTELGEALGVSKLSGAKDVIKHSGKLFE